LFAEAGIAPPTKTPYQEALGEMTTGQRLLAGIGGGMKGLALGAGQRLGLVDQAAVDEYRNAMDPLSITGAGLAGSVIGQAAIAAPAMFVPGANSAIGASALGGLNGLSQPTRADESAGLNALMGAGAGVAGKYLGDAVGAGAGKLLDKLRAGGYLNVGGRAAAAGGAQAGAQASVTGGSQAGAGTIAAGGGSAAVRGGGSTMGTVGPDPSSMLTPAMAQAAEKGRALGLRTTAGQQSGSRALQQLEAKLESQPMFSGPFNTLKIENQKAINRAAAGALGESGDVVDSALLAHANERIGEVYNAVRATGRREIEPNDFLARLSKVEREYEGLIGDGSRSIAEHPLVRRFMSYAENGDASSEQLADLASKLSKAGNTQMTSGAGDRQLGMALFDVKNHVDDLLQGGLKPELQQLFGQARQQYRNLMLLTQREGVVNPASGNVSGANLARMLQAKDRAGYLMGGNQSDLYNAARFAQAFKPIVGDSGTATRSALTNPMEALLAIPASTASWMYLSRPGTAAAAAAARGVGRAGAAAAGAAQTAGAAGRALTIPMLDGTRAVMPYALPVVSPILAAEFRKQYPAKP
jgi:hypothetical protein